MVEGLITDRDWIYGINLSKPKYVYIICVGERTCKIGSCDPTLKHLKARLMEAKRWVPDARLVAVKLYSSVEEERFLHKALGASKEVVKDWDGYSMFLVVSRFSFHSVLKGKDLSWDILPKEAKVPQGCNYSSYCENDAEFFLKIESFERHRDRLNSIIESMTRDWGVEDYDDGYYYDWGNHHGLAECIIYHDYCFQEAIEAGAIL